LLVIFLLKVNKIDRSIEKIKRVKKQDIGCLNLSQFLFWKIRKIKKITQNINTYL
jgi:hypothetical protein